jgi:hypothetical protein
VTNSRPEGERQSPPRLDTGVAHSARVWNYLLGGADNFAADREMCDVMLQMFPGIIGIAREQRRFLARSVRYLAAEAGIRQFLDIGVGLPVGTSTHQVAQGIAPGSRVVYVDNDPLVLLHARALLTSAPGGETSYIEADVRDTEEILGQAAQTLDFGRPVALVMLGIMGQLPDSASPESVLARLLAFLPRGSYLALSDGIDTSRELNEAITVYNENSASSYHVRAPRRIARFFDGLTLVPPGVVAISRWRPDVFDASAKPRAVEAVGGVARKEGPALRLVPYLMMASEGWCRCLLSGRI